MQIDNPTPNPGQPTVGWGLGAEPDLGPLSRCILA